ncbi:MAG: sigma-70 family RNA polymerase sigma factor [Opitutaceae bacterium]|nr:sigma-70 family RNA polymerase sigma factor [Cytophagales bacterium]
MYTEQELISGCKKGDPQAQEALYKTYASRMRYICQRYARTTFETEDIFQDAFVKILTQIEKFNGNGSLDGWIRRIFINSAIDYYKKNKKLNEQISLNVQEDFQLASIEEDEDFISEIAGKLSEADLLELITSLPDGYRMVFNLFAIESYSHIQIADALNISVGTSKSQLSKARQTLKKNILEQLAKQKTTVELNLDPGVLKIVVSA